MESPSTVDIPVLPEIQVGPDRFGKYELLERIGSGGMAEIFRAKLPGISGFEKIVVIKRILPHLAKDQGIAAMFVEEAKIAARVQHRNVVQVFELGKEGDDLYMAMEYISGIDLAALLRSSVAKKIKLPIWFSLHVVSEILSGLACAHELLDEHGQPLRVVHRDVSPSNLFLSHQGDIKLGDFGVALSANRDIHTRAGELKGKVAYMAPEQLYQQPLDARVDVFAAGVVLWELLTQRRLFGGKPEIEIMNSICRSSRPLPSRFNPDVPKELDRIVLAALEADVELRTRSAAELQRQILSILPSFAAQIVPSDVRAVVEAVLGRTEAGAAPQPLKEPSVPPRTSLGASFLENTPRAGDTRDALEVKPLSIVPAAAPAPEPRDEPEMVIQFEESSEAPQAGRSEEGWLFGGAGGPRVVAVADRAAQLRADTPPWQTIGYIKPMHRDPGSIIHDGGYRGPHPFWLMNGEELIWGPCDYVTIRRYLSSDLERAAHSFRIAGHETEWIDLDVFAALTGQESLIKPTPLPDERRISGSLRTRSLCSALAAIWASRSTGRLVVLGEDHHNPPRRELHFVGGVPTYVATDSSKLQLPAILMREAMLRKELLPQVMHDVLAHQEPIEDAAARHSAISAEQHFPLFMRARAAEIFTWRGGSFAFETGFTGRKGRPFARSALQLALYGAGRAMSEAELYDRVAGYTDKTLSPSERLPSFFRDVGFIDEQARIARSLWEGQTLSSLLQRQAGDVRGLLVVAYLLVELGMVNIQL